MRKLMAGIAATALALGMAACSGGAGTSDAKGEPLTLEAATGSWVLVDGKGPEGDVKPTEETPIDLTIESDGAFHGSSGCNSIMGTMTVEDGVVDMGAIGQTLMACEEPAMQLEFAYTQALDAVNAGSASGEELVLTGADTELRYKKG